MRKESNVIQLLVQILGVLIRMLKAKILPAKPKKVEENRPLSVNDEELVMLYRTGVGVKIIAEVLGCTPQSIRSRLVRIGEYRKR